MKTQAYMQGMNKLAQEYGYADWQALEKDAGLLSSVGRIAGKGALIGGGIGAIGGAMTGPEGQSMGDRLGRGVAGGVMGVGAGALAGGIGQKMYRQHVTGIARGMKATGGNAGMIQGMSNQYANAPHFLSTPMAKARQAIQGVAPRVGNALWNR
jgi:hypothetical protein